MANTSSIRISNGKIYIGDGVDAIEISGQALNVSSLANKIAGHYPDMYPWGGYPDDGFRDAIQNNFSDPDFPPNNIPVAMIPACLRAIKDTMTDLQNQINSLGGTLAALNASAVKASLATGSVKK